MEDASPFGTAQELAQLDARTAAPLALFRDAPASFPKDADRALAATVWAVLQAPADRALYTHARNPLSPDRREGGRRSASGVVAEPVGGIVQIPLVLLRKGLSEKPFVHESTFILAV